MAAPPRPASPAPTVFLSARSVIRATAYIVPARRDNDGPPFYRIIAGPDHEPGAAEQIFVTRDPELYAAAMAIEGTERRVQLQWHPGQTASTHRTLRVLEALR